MPKSVVLSWTEYQELILANEYVIELENRVHSLLMENANLSKDNPYNKYIADADSKGLLI